MNMLMADVSLTTVDDPESMVQYGRPIPDGQMDDAKGNAIKADPTVSSIEYLHMALKAM